MAASREEVKKDRQKRKAKKHQRSVDRKGFLAAVHQSLELVEQYFEGGQKLMAFETPENYELALKQFELCLKELSKPTTAKMTNRRFYHGIASLYLNICKKELSFDNLSDSLLQIQNSIAELRKIKAPLLTREPIAIGLYHCALILEKQKQDSKAVDCLVQAIKSFQRVHADYKTGILLIKLGSISFAHHIPGQASIFFVLAKKHLSNKTDYTQAYAKALQSAGACFYQTGEYKGAAEMFHQALEGFQDCSGDKRLVPVEQAINQMMLGLTCAKLSDSMQDFHFDQAKSLLSKFSPSQVRHVAKIVLFLSNQKNLFEGLESNPLIKRLDQFFTYALNLKRKVKTDSSFKPEIDFFKSILPSRELKIEAETGEEKFKDQSRAGTSEEKLKDQSRNSPTSFCPSPSPRSGFFSPRRFMPLLSNVSETVVSESKSLVPTLA